MLPSGSAAAGSFISSFIIVFREVLEVALVLAIILAATNGVARRGRIIAFGLAAGLCFVGGIAWAFDQITASFDGFGQEVMQAAILIFSALCIAATVIWMKRHGRALAGEAREVSRRVAAGRAPAAALVALIGCTVARDGAEVVILSSGLLAAGGVLSSIVFGLVAAILAGCVLLALFVRGSARLPIGLVFDVTSVLLMFLAAGMMAQGIVFLQSAGVVWWSEQPLWDTSHIVAGESWLGFTLHTLVGYSPRPSLVQVLAYGSTMAVIALGWFAASRRDGTVLQAIRGTAAAGLAAAALFFPASARAIDTIYSPSVELGEVELEARSANVLSGSGKNDWASRLGVGYAPTDSWMFEGYGNFDRAPGEELHVAGWSVETRYELTEPGEYLLDWGIYGEFTGTTRGSDAEEVEAKVLIEHAAPRFIATANVIMEQEVGSAREEDLEGGLSFTARYRAAAELEPGLEVHSEFGELADMGGFDDQEHLVGPCLWGEIDHHVGYEVAYLFGVSAAASDSVLRAALEYEF